MSISCLYLSDFTPTSLNKSVGRHWSVKAKQKKGDRELVALARLKQEVTSASCKRRVSLRIVLPKGQRACDPDNMHKSLSDALVQCGLLCNDSPKWVEWGDIEYVRHSGNLRETFVILEDLD